MSNAIVEALEKAAKEIEQAVKDAAASVEKFFRETGERLEQSAKRLVGADEQAASDLGRITPEDEHPTVHDEGSDAHPAAGEATAPVHRPAEVNRERSLGEDPAQGGKYRPHEYDNAVRVQEELGVRLRRDPSGDREWFDESGTSYDLMGPVPSQYLNTPKQWRKLVESMHDHVGKADVVPFDLTGLSETQIERIKSEAAAAGGRFVWLH